MSRETGTTRKDRILDAAEHAFADFGFDGASLRQIVLNAGVNLATVYYYFESKKGLMLAVIQRRFDPLKQYQMELLENMTAASKGRPVPLTQLLNAMIAPTFCLTKSPGGIALRLIGRMLTEPSEPIQELLRRQFADARAAFLREFKRTLPRLTHADLLWRIEFAWGALAAILCNPRKIKQRTAGCCDPANREQLREHLLPFFVAGFRAPATRSHD